MTSLKTLPKSEKVNVWVFPGQGSQKLGMGIDLLKLPLGKLRLKQAENILGWSIYDVWQSQTSEIDQYAVHSTLSLCFYDSFS